MAFKQVEVLKLRQIFGYFSLYAKTTVPILRFCSIEKFGFGNLLRLNGYNLLLAKKNMSVRNRFDRFSEI